MNLSAKEIAELTQRTRAGWQRKQLDHLGIPYKARSDGSLVVLRVHVDAMHHEAPPAKRPQLRLAP